MIKYVLVHLLLVLSFCVSATENMYVVIGTGYAKTELESTDADGANIKFAVGYQFHRQWYLELGFQQLADESIQTSLPSDQAALESFQPGLESDALFAALLGKASSRLGELYYRIGAKKVDNRGQILTQDTNCPIGQASLQAAGYTLCDFDESVLAGVIGLGFDYFIGNKSMLRTEVEYVSGEQDFEATSLFIGYRYNF